MCNSQAYVRLLLLYFGLKNVWPVGLADIAQLKGGLCRIPRQLGQILPHFHQSLRGKDLVSPVFIKDSLVPERGRPNQAERTSAILTTGLDHPCRSQR